MSLKWLRARASGAGSAKEEPTWLRRADPRGTTAVVVSRVWRRLCSGARRWLRRKGRRSPTGPVAALPPRPGSAGRRERCVPGTGFFNGANLPLYGGDVLIVIVYPWVLTDATESTQLVEDLRERFGRTIVLVAQDSRGVPTYWGPTAITMVLRAIPFDALPWSHHAFDQPLARTVKLGG